MARKIAVSYKTSIDFNGDGIVYANIRGKDVKVGVIPHASNNSSAINKEYALAMLSSNDIVIDPDWKPVGAKKAIAKESFLRKFLKSNGKITMTPADRFEERIAYNLIYKPTGKFVVDIAARGFVMSNAKTAFPLNFTKADINVIDNLDDFEVVKTKVRCAYITNKIAPDDRKGGK